MSSSTTCCRTEGMGEWLIPLCRFRSGLSVLFLVVPGSVLFCSVFLLGKPDSSEQFVCVFGMKTLGLVLEEQLLWMLFQPHYCVCDYSVYFQVLIFSLVHHPCWFYLCHNQLAEKNIFKYNLYFRYNKDTGIFTVPIGGNGTYFLSLHLSVAIDKSTIFNMEANGDVICLANGDQDSGAGDHGNGGCSGLAQLEEGGTCSVVPEMIYPVIVCLNCLLQWSTFVQRKFCKFPIEKYSFWQFGSNSDFVFLSTGDEVQVVYTVGVSHTDTPLYAANTAGFLAFIIWTPTCVWFLVHGSPKWQTSNADKKQ